MKNTRTRPQSGFTMLEVLIAMVIIAFGLLGVAGLQAFALQSNQSAQYRSTAAMLASDIADRVRTNIGGSIDGQYNQPTAAGYTTDHSRCSGGCTTTQLAENDLFEWQQRIAVSLPGGVGRVCLDTTPHDGTTSATPACDAAGGANRTNYVVKIWWTDDRTRAAASTATVANCTSGTCRFSTTFNQ